MTVFDRPNFRVALQNGVCNPPNRLAPLVKVSPRCYSRLASGVGMTLHEHYVQAASRMTADAFGQVRMAATRALRCANNYFPAYSFHIGEFINDEWLSSVDWHKKFHRDHILHQLLTVYVGNTILVGNGTDEFVVDDTPIINRCLNAVLFAPECAYLRDYLRTMGAPSIYFNGDELARRLWTDILKESFFLAAMYHDIGYPWQFVSTIQNKLGPNGPPMSPMTRGVEWVHDHYRDRLLMYPLRGYQPFSATLPSEWIARCKETMYAAFSKTHGLPGALALLHLNDALREYPIMARDHAVSRFCIEWAAMAIMMHDMRGIYAGQGCSEPMPHLRVSLTRDPLSFLLTLTDQIQDFGRINAAFARSGDRILVSYDAACHKVEISRVTLPRELHIKFYFKNGNAARMNASKFKRDDERDYFDPTSGYLDYHTLPIDRIRLLVEYDPGGKW